MKKTIVRLLPDSFKYKYINWPYKFSANYRAIIYPELRLMYFIINKNASTTTRELFKDYKSYLITNTGYCKRAYRSYFKFTVLRNPVERLISAYQGKILQFGKSNLLQEFQGGTFPEFVYWVSQQDLKKADIHIRYQYVSFDDSVFIISMENYNIKMKDLLDTISIKKNIPITNKSKYKIEVSNDLKEIIKLIYKKDYEIWKKIN